MAVKPSSPAVDASHSLATGLEAFWLMGEGSGTTITAYGDASSADMTLSNSPTWDSDGQGNFLDFDPASSYASTAGHISEFDVGAFTVAARVKSSGVSGNRRIFTHTDSGGSEGCSLYLNGTTHYFATKIGTFFPWGRPLGTADADGWHTIICRVTGTHVKQDIDGTSYSLARAGSNTTVSDSTPAYIATLDGMQQFFDDGVQAVAFWSIDIGDAGVTSLEADFFGVLRGSAASSGAVRRRVNGGLTVPTLVNGGLVR